MKKTIVKFMDGTYGYYFGTVSHVVTVQGEKIDWESVVATATVDEHDEYPNI